LNKKPRFFCDNCGIEVGRDAKACPQCGRYFAKVRCPSCGFTGEEGVFSQGCPSCGYSSPPLAIVSTPPATEQKIPAKSLPLWVYILSICAFIGVVALLIARLTGGN
jgi:uncharacterized membrane protein YvbJ